MSDNRFDGFLEAVKVAYNPPYGRDREITLQKPKVATILDAFSTDCFAPEIDAIPVTPADYVQAFDYFNPEFLLIESAWQGNDSTWTHQLVGSGGPKNAFYRLVESARKRNIPIVFWNKEDPPHFQDFLPVAKEADLVLTTAGELIDDYAEAIGHNRVGVLPFAAQPKIHHPFGRNDSENEICFAGQYFAHKYPERRNQMDFLFPAAAEHDFTIFSRELGNDPNYAFPAPFDRLVRGSKPYEEMVKAYRDYKIFINVNSVVNSETMCARRIFEITASGSVVVSAASPAIHKFYADDEVFTPSTLEEARAAFDYLLGSNEANEIATLKSWRRTLSSHTYGHRIRSVMKMLGIDPGDTMTEPSLVIDARGHSNEQVRSVLESCQQHFSRFTNRFLITDSDTEPLVWAGESIDVLTIPDIQSVSGTDLVYVNAGAILGERAIPDMLLAVGAYRDRGPIAKLAYNSSSAQTYSTGVTMWPPLWGASSESMTVPELASIISHQHGTFDTLDKFNVLDSSLPFASSSAAWEV